MTMIVNTLFADSVTSFGNTSSDLIKAINETPKISIRQPNNVVLDYIHNRRPSETNISQTTIKEIVKQNTSKI